MAVLPSPICKASRPIGGLNMGVSRLCDRLQLYIQICKMKALNAI